MRTQPFVTLPSRKWSGSAPLSRRSTMDQEETLVSRCAGIMAHPRKLLPKPPASTPINSIITLGDSTVEVSNKNRQVVPPHTGKLINATVNGKAIVKNQTDTVFSYKNSFLHKANQLSVNKVHPSMDENYFGLNSLDQATLVNPSNDADVYFFNETNTPITISGNCIIGFISPFTPVVALMQPQSAFF